MYISMTLPTGVALALAGKQANLEKKLEDAPHTPPDFRALGLWRV